jgi:integrase
VNKTVAALRAALQEGFYREELTVNPALEIGELMYQKNERGTFLPAELQALFAVDPPGPWRDLQAFVCFLLAWANGLRRGELLVLRWRHVDLETKILRVDDAWKGGEEIGAPKWGHRREEALSAAAVTALEALREDSIHTLPDDLVFCEDDGSMHSEQWWRDCFADAMAAVKVGKDKGIDVRARRLTPHSFRHTINTQLLDDGVDPEKIRATLGWTNMATQKGYTHFKADHLREPAAVVDKFLAGHGGRTSLPTVVNSEPT